MLDTNITLDRNKTGYIVCILLGALFLFCSLLLMIIMTSWAFDLRLVYIFVVLIVCMFVFICLAISIYKQPVITLTNDKIIIIRNNLIIDKRDAKIDILVDKITNKKIFIILLMGIIPGLLMVFFQGRNRIIITYNNDQFEIRNISKYNIKLISSFLKLHGDKTNNVESNLLYKLDNLRLRDKVRKKSEQKLFISLFAYLTIIFTVFSTIYLTGLNSNYYSGFGTKDFPYIIKTREQFEYFSGQANLIDNKNKYYALKADIDFNGEEITTVGTNYGQYFYGHFDGRGHKIINFKITEYNYRVGLFRINSGTIKNIGIENFIIDIKEEDGYDKEGFIIGPLVSYNEGLIINCYALNGNILINSTDGDIIAGGLVGANSEEISNSYSACNITAYSEHNSVLVGGFVGKHSSDIKIYNCFATGNIDTTVTLEIEDCQAGGFSPVVFYETNFCYQDQIIKRTYQTPPVSTYIPSISVDYYCSLDDLNSKSFYVNKLKWNENIWDFSNLDFINGKLPRLK